MSTTGLTVATLQSPAEKEKGMESPTSHALQTLQSQSRPPPRVSIRIFGPQRLAQIRAAATDASRAIEASRAMPIRISATHAEPPEDG